MTEPPVNPVAAFVCPFCGSPTPDQPRCAHCSGPLDPLSRQATQNAMGPWFIRDEQHPFRPGCSYETILTMVARGKITSDTILRGPSTSQFWYPAKRVPGVAHRLGVCHSCQQAVGSESECSRCGAVFHADPDRQFLGLMPVRPLPGNGAAMTGGVAGVAQPAHEPARVAEPVGMPPAGSTEVSGSSRVRASALCNRMEAEIASLRVRNAVLIAVSGVCALVALGAIWMVASGIGEGGSGIQANPGSASSVGGRTLPPAPSESPSGAAHPPHPRGSTADSPESTNSPNFNSGERTNSVPEVVPGPNSPSEPKAVPDVPAKPSEELSLLRSTRWP